MVDKLRSVGISAGGGFGGEWFFNDNISLELSTGLGYMMVKDSGTLGVLAVEAVPANDDEDTEAVAAVPGVDGVAASTTNSVVTWTTAVGFNLYW